LRPETRCEDELELSIHLDQLDQVHFVLEQIVTSVEVVVPLLRVLVPEPLLEAAAEVVNQSSFEDFGEVVVVRFAVPNDLFDLVFLVRLFLVRAVFLVRLFFLVPAVFLVLGVHALHEMTLVAEGLVPSDDSFDDCPNECCITTDVGEDLVVCYRSPVFFHLLGALHKPNTVEPHLVIKHGINFRESSDHRSGPLVVNSFEAVKSWHIRRVKPSAVAIVDLVLFTSVEGTDSRTITKLIIVVVWYVAFHIVSVAVFRVEILR